MALSSDPTRRREHPTERIPMSEFMPDALYELGRLAARFGMSRLAIVRLGEEALIARGVEAGMARWITEIFAPQVAGNIVSEAVMEKQFLSNMKEGVNAAFKRQGIPARVSSVKLGR